MVIGILKTYILKHNVALGGLQVHGSRLIEDINIRVHDLQKALNPRHAPLELLGKFNNPAHRGNKGGHIHHIGHQIAGPDGSPNHEKPACHDGHQIHQTVKKPGGTLKKSHVTVTALFDLIKFSIVLLKLFVLHIFVGKGLHHLLPQQTVLDPSVQFSHLLPLLAEQRPQPEVDPAAHHHHHRNDAKDKQRQRYIDGTQNDKGGCPLDPGDKEFLRAVMGKLRHIKQIVGDAPHDLPHLSVVIIGVGQLLQMPVGVPAHIRLYIHPHHMTGIGHIIVSRRVNQPQCQVQKPQSSHGAHRQHRQVLHGLVGDMPDNQRQHDLADGGQGRAEQVQTEHFHMGFIVGHKPFNQYR